MSGLYVKTAGYSNLFPMGSYASLLFINWVIRQSESYLKFISFSMNYWFWYNICAAWKSQTALGQDNVWNIQLHTDYLFTEVLLQVAVLQRKKWWKILFCIIHMRKINQYMDTFIIVCTALLMRTQSSSFNFLTHPIHHVILKYPRIYQTLASGSAHS